jgi:hypothetical protein
MGGVSYGSRDGFFDYAPPLGSPSLPLRTEHDYKLGPVGSGLHRLEIWKPSRVSVGAGTTIHLPETDPTRGPVVFELPELESEIVRGRVVLPADVPGERVAIAASRVTGARRTVGRDEPLHHAALGVDGAFAIDLPHGTYAIQLADMETGILFHTAEEDVIVERDMAPLHIQPEIHWLQLDLQPARAAEELYISAIEVKLPRPRENLGPLLEPSGSSPTHENRFVSFHADSARRWLVPGAQIELTPTLRSRRLGDGEGEPITLARLAVDIDQPEQSVVLRAPPAAGARR